MGSETVASPHTSRVERAQTIHRTEVVRENAESALRYARQLIEWSRELRSTDPSWPRFFVVHGYVEERHVRAAWFRGGLLASSALRDRAQILVAMRESFSIDDDAPVIDASLQEPFAAMLTLIRSCDRLEDARFGPIVGDQHPPPPWRNRAS